MKTTTFASLACALLLAPTSGAHVVLEQKSAPAGSYYRGLFRVGHGCEGSATTSITVRIPEGVQNAKPAPKPGWTLERKLEKLATPISHHGKTVTERVAEVTWRGGPLADEHYDEFIMQIQLPPSAGALWFRVLQQCESGRIDWSEVPVSGTSTRGLKAPAALLEVTPAPAANAPQPSSKAAETHKH